MRAARGAGMMMMMMMMMMIQAGTSLVLKYSTFETSTQIPRDVSIYTGRVLGDTQGTLRRIAPRNINTNPKGC